MPAWPSNGDLNWNDKMAAFIAVGHESDGSLKADGVGRRWVGTFEIPNLAAGASLTDHVFFGSYYASTMTRIGILTHGSPAGIDDSNTVVILIENSADASVVSKTYNLATQPPSSGFEDLGALSVTAFTSNDYLKVTVTQGTTADMPAFAIVLE